MENIRWTRSNERRLIRNRGRRSGTWKRRTTPEMWRSDSKEAELKRRTGTSGGERKISDSKEEPPWTGKHELRRWWIDRSESWRTMKTNGCGHQKHELGDERCRSDSWVTTINWTRKDAWRMMNWASEWVRMEIFVKMIRNVIRKWNRIVFGEKENVRKWKKVSSENSSSGRKR